MKEWDINTQVKVVEEEEKRRRRKERLTSFTQEVGMISSVNVKHAVKCNINCNMLCKIVLLGIQPASQPEHKNKGTRPREPM